MCCGILKRGILAMLLKIIKTALFPLILFVCIAGIANAEPAGTTHVLGAKKQTLTSANDTVNAGYYAATTLSAVDQDLTAGNIAVSTTIFGILGTFTYDATPAAAGDILSGKNTYVNGTKITGTVPAGANVTGGNGVLAVPIPNGLYSGGDKTATANDTNLTAGNIKDGVTIFGVTGTYKGFCRGDADKNTHTTINGDVVYCDNNLRMWTPTAPGTYNWGPAKDEADDSCVGKGADYPACNYCDGLTYAGFADWQLPADAVLKSFWTTPCGGASCGPGNPGVNWDTNAHTGADVGGGYWSSSEWTEPGGWNQAWFVSFGGGWDAATGKVSMYMYVRCVRQPAG